MLNNSITTTTFIQSWFIPIDILVLTCLILATLSSLILLLIILREKTCHTVPMLLIANSCLSEMVFAATRIGAIVFSLQNDLQHTAYQDPFCIFRAYLADGVCAIMNFSFLLQAIYRYVTVVYLNRLFFQSVRLQIVLISITWVFGLTYPLEFTLRGEVIYNIDNQICQLTLRFSFSIIYMVFCIYLLPISFVMFIYFKLVRFVREMGKRVTPANVLSRAQRELRMVQRTIILVSILVTLGFPYTIFMIIGFFGEIPKYHFRIAFVFVDVSAVFISIALYQFNDPIRLSVMKRIKRRTNVIVATTIT